MHRYSEDQITFKKTQHVLKLSRSSKG